MLGLGDQHLDLLVGDLLLGFALLAEQPEDGAAGNVEQEDQRRGDFGQQVIAGATRAAMPSGLRSAICLGTSSPTISEQ